jgi:precorrin-6B C5,15-methyltransferase / cobalt-precorrin-6B C5,C15-methyltransferase
MSLREITMADKLYVVGVGPGAIELMLPAAKSIIEESDIIAGGKRNLELFADLQKESFVIGNNLDELYNFIITNIKRKKIVVLASGDPGLYSITEFLKVKLPDTDIEVVPGISSLQYLCCKIKLSRDDMKITSVHGRKQEDLISIIKNNNKVAVFTGGEYSPDKICRELFEKGITNVRITVGENLSYQAEKVISGTPEEIGRIDFDKLTLMITERISNSQDLMKLWDYSTHGVPDELFIRGEVPMTKEEVRALSLSKLRLKTDSIVYDIGAGTGSVSIECGLKCPEGKIYSIEKNIEALGLIGENIDRFGLVNIDIVKGEAPVDIKGLPKPDRVFIGGSGGNMDAILKWIDENCDKVRVVINTITIESAYEAIKGLEKIGFENIEITNISVSRSKKAGDKHLMQAINPVYVICGEKN